MSSNSHHFSLTRDVVVVLQLGATEEVWNAAVTYQIGTSQFGVFVPYSGHIFPVNFVDFDKPDIILASLKWASNVSKDIMLDWTSTSPIILLYHHLDPPNLIDRSSRFISFDSMNAAAFNELVQQRKKIVLKSSKSVDSGYMSAHVYLNAEPKSFFLHGVPSAILKSRRELSCCPQCGSAACSGPSHCDIAYQEFVHYVRAVLQNFDTPSSYLTLPQPLQITSQLSFISSYPGTVYLMGLDEDLKAQREECGLCKECGLFHPFWTVAECGEWVDWSRLEWEYDMLRKEEEDSGGESVERGRSVHERLFGRGN
jgi:hypothetical protein